MRIFIFNCTSSIASGRKNYVCTKGVGSLVLFWMLVEHCKQPVECLKLAYKHHNSCIYLHILLNLRKSEMKYRRCLIWKIYIFQIPEWPF